MSLFKIWFFIILVLVLGLVGFLGFTVKQLDYWGLRLDGRPAQLEQASKSSPPGPMSTVSDRAERLFEVKYTTVEGKRVVFERYVPTEIVAKLVAGGKVDIVYMPDNNRRFVYKGEERELPLGIPDLLLGLGATGFFFVLLIVKRREDQAR